MQLAGKTLIATPGMSDPRFARSVILICAHDHSSAMGLVVNRRIEDLAFADLLRHLDLSDASVAQDPAPLVHFGGPVERTRGFVLHSDDWQSTDGESLLVPGGYCVTSTLDILVAMAAGTGPKRALLALGYSGWGAGQLDGEIQRNDWLVADVLPEVLFRADDAEKWAMALRGMGVDPVTLSGAAGRA